MSEDPLDSLRRDALAVRIWEQGDSYVRISRLSPKIILSETCGIVTQEGMLLIVASVEEFVDDGVTQLFVNPSKVRRYDPAGRDKLLSAVRARRDRFEAIHFNLEGTAWTVQMVISIVSVITRIVHRHDHKSFEAALLEAVSQDQVKANHG